VGRLNLKVFSSTGTGLLTARGVTPSRYHCKLSRVHSVSWRARRPADRQLHMLTPFSNDLLRAGFTRVRHKRAFR
jgi:hypothetical protein